MIVYARDGNGAGLGWDPIPRPRFLVHGPIPDLAGMGIPTPSPIHYPVNPYQSPSLA